MEMSDELREAAFSCQKNNLATLQSLVPSHIKVNELVPQIKLNLLKVERKNVPLLCIAAASGSFDCVKYLVKSGANVDATDNTVLFLIFFIFHQNFVFFFNNFIFNNLIFLSVLF